LCLDDYSFQNPLLVVLNCWYKKFGTISPVVPGSDWHKQIFGTRNMDLLYCVEKQTTRLETPSSFSNKDSIQRPPKAQQQTIYCGIYLTMKDAHRKETGAVTKTRYKEQK
jgi:hypothetical protein